MAERNFIGTSRVDLRTLPEFAPGSGLWARIESGVRARRSRRRWSAVGLAVTATAVALVTLVPMQRGGPPTSSQTLTGQAQSQMLEKQWQELAASVRTAPAGATRLRVIDAALQSAYDRGAAPNEIQPLWKERNRALRGLIDGYRTLGTLDGLAVTRI